jgi:hypothetical protein
MARTAVVAGTATAVSNNVSRRQYARQQGKADAAAYQDQQQQEAEWAQQQQWAAQQAAAAPAPAAGGGDDVIEQLTKLGALHEQGILTDEEFAAQKAKLLG